MVEEIKFEEGVKPISKISWTEITKMNSLKTQRIEVTLNINWIRFFVCLTVFLSFCHLMGWI